MKPIGFVFVAAAAALAACASDPTATSGFAGGARTSTERWPVTVSSQPYELRLAARADGLSAAQSDALAGFASDWRAAGGPVELRAPVGGPDAVWVSRSTEAVRAYLAAQGLPAAAVTVAGYDAQGDRAAPLTLTRRQYAVDVPQCGREWTNIAHSWSNEPQPNFGCAITSNMAVQVANPADLTRPAAIAPADVQRREIVMGKYRMGEVTASAKDEQASGAVARQGN